jgi:NAD(P)-dependent dehydrogenase (short-subunit alcohol dehydrogenase family)
MRLKNKTVVITGGNGFLGQEFCQHVLKNGGNLAILDINEAVKDLVTKLKSEFSNQKIQAYLCDLIDEDAVKATVSLVIEDFGVINILVNNAASKSEDLESFFAPFEDYSLSEWRKIMHANVDSMFLMAKEVGKHMVENKIKGSIIQLSSIYGVCAPDQSLYEGAFYLNTQINTPAVYSTSKSAVIGLSKYLAAYWGKAGIRVNTLTPGGIESGQNDTFITKYSQKVPLGRMGKASDIANALVYLASDESVYVTGQNLIVDGGFTAW